MGLALRRYWKTATMAATGYVGDSPLFFVEYLLWLVRVLLLLSIWRLILTGRGTVDGLALEQVLTYTLVAHAFGELLLVHSHFHILIWDGSVAVRYLQPIGIVSQVIVEMMGRWIFGLAFFGLPLFVIAPLLGVDPRPASAAHGLLFVASLVLGVAVGFAIDFFFGLLIVATGQNPWLIDQVRWSVIIVLSGVLVPLALLPWGLGAVFNWLPFAAMSSSPLRIYTGTGEPLPLMLAQAAWAVVLWLLVLWLWRSCREKLVGYGG